MESFWCLRWLYISTIHRAWRGFKSLNLRDTLTSPGATPFDNCLLTLSAYHALNLFEINFFADWLMLISKGWNLFVRLCGTITNSQLLFKYNHFIPSLSWPLKVSIIIKDCCSSGYPLLLADKYGKMITLNRSSHFPKLYQWFGGKCGMKMEEKCEFWQASFWFTLINQLNRQKGACSRNYKNRCNLSFVIKPFDRNIFWPLWWKCILPRRDIRKGVWTRIKTRADGTSWSNIAF